MSNYSDFVIGIKEFEGGKLHYNKGEVDITNGYGIYRGDNPNAKVFSIYDEIAKANGINNPSKKWNKEDIELIDSKLNSDARLKEQELNLTIEFYQEYFKPLSKFIDVFYLNPLIGIPYANIFLNSNKIGNKSLQESYNLIIQSGLSTLYPDISEMKPIDEDGIVGPGTRKAIYGLNDLFSKGSNAEKTLFFNYWKNVYISCCKTNYVDISTDNLKKEGTDKQLQYIRGWINRCDKLVYKTKKGI